MVTVPSRPQFAPPPDLSSNPSTEVFKKCEINKIRLCNLSIQRNRSLCVRNLLKAEKKMKTLEYSFQDWTITTTKSHILPSKCSCHEDIQCTVCRYSNELTLPSLPDMIFSDNILKIEHKDLKSGIFFNALNALKKVNDKQDDIKVAISKAWSRANVSASLEVTHEVSNPFDWTFTTDYQGTLFGDGLQIAPTDKSIDLNKLKEKETILFFDEIHLYEDELADHGCSSCTVKIRVMPSGFFVLHRLYLRVDEVLIRINDTRLYYERGNNYMIREYTSRESKTEDLTCLSKTHCIVASFRLKNEFA
ncbi:TIP41-like protein isoform X2 [Artemia franciscana]|uniref:TIP41-like protein isoform X2 n=1 Tax=Artemia franciscana TaxID=6661 RepID=UPI0032DA8AF1